MHIFVSSQVNYKVYKKLENLRPRNASFRFMSETVKAVEKHKILTNPKGQGRSTNEEVVWKASAQSAPTSRNNANNTPSRSTKQQQHQNNENRSGQTVPTTVECYNCDETGHLRKHCKVCAFCKIEGHTAKVCRKRIAQAQGKYCSFCQKYLEWKWLTSMGIKLRQMQRNPGNVLNLMLRADYSR